ncbi:hypothetical protein ACIGO8_09010 [Streptomyces sp. NPDC053493]|uniref:hypothetical protein n=1 Tax=Streptomyces sp. NPDC053493 TaxID=3365705 RepID=UPI0037CE6C61
MTVTGVHGEAFVVCVDAYDQEPDAALESARRCAEDFRELARRLGFDASTPVISGTKHEIEDALDRIRESPAPRKLLYWVGHGVKTGRDGGVLPCRDYRRAGNRKVFTPAELASVLTGSSGDLLLIVDTCHAADIAYAVYQEYVDQEVSRDATVPGPAGADVPGRGIGCLGTVGGEELAQVGLWLGAWKELVESRAYEFRQEPLWNAYARAVHGMVVLEAVHHVLARSPSGDLVTPRPHGGTRLLGFFRNPYYDPTARPVSAAAPTRRQELLGEQVQRMLRSRFRGLWLEEEGEALFVGRRHSLARITEWLTSSARSGILVVTGAPGCGKSALLGQIAMMTIKDTPQYLALPAERRVGLAGAILAGIQCRGRSALECAAELARGMRIEEPSSGWKDVGEVVRALIAACRAEGDAAFLVDGLDETDPAHLDSLVTEVLGPLGQQPNVRILVGTRPTAGSALSLLDASTHELDTVHDRWDDIAAYVHRRLGVPGSAYADDAALREAVARELVRRSQGVFLVARLHCTALVRSGKALAPDAEEFRGLLASGLEEALDQEIRDLDRVAAAGPGGAVAPGWARGLLLPLALSYGAGLPHADGIWLQAARRLAELRGQAVSYTSDDVRRIRSVAGAHIVEYGEAGQPVYRLSHEAMGHHLLEGAGAPAELHAAMTDVLLGAHRATYRGRGATNPYIARHATAHAAAAGRLDEVAKDAEFLVNAEPERLLSLLDRPGAAAGAETALYRRVAEELIGKSPAERSALLQATALYQQPELRSWARSPGLSFWSDEWTTTPPVPPFRTLKVPQGDVRAVAADSDGGGLLAAGERLWHWRRPGGRPDFLHQWLGSGAFHALSAAPSGAGLTAVADAERLVVWTSEAGPVLEYGWGARIGDVAAGAPGGTPLVAAASGTTLSVWAWRDGRPRHRGFWPWPRPGLIQGVAVGALDDRACVLAGGDGGVVVWDARTGEQVLAFAAEGGRADALAAAAWRDGLHVAVLGTARPQVRVWRVTGGPRPGAELVHAAALRHASGSAVALSDHPDDPLVAAVDGGTVRLWRVEDGEELPRLTGHRTQPRSVAFLRDEERSVCVADGSGIRIWQSASGPSAGAAPSRPRTGMPGSGSAHTGAMAGARPGAGAVALAAEDAVRVWDLGGRHLADDRALERVSSLALRATPDGTVWLAAGGRHPVHGPCVRVRRLTAATGDSGGGGGRDGGADGGGPGGEDFGGQSSGGDGSGDEDFGGPSSGGDGSGRDGSDGDGFGEADFAVDLHRDSSVTAVGLVGTREAVHVLAAKDRHILRWDLSTRERLEGMHVGVGRIEHLAVVESPGAEPFVAATAGDSVWIWQRAESGPPLRFRLPKPPPGRALAPARALAGTHDARGGPLVAVATSDGVFTGSLDDRLEEGTGRRELRLFRAAADVRSLAFCPSAGGRLVMLAASRTRTVHEWALDARGEDRLLPDRGYDVHQVFAAPGGSGPLLAAVGRERMDVLRLEDRRG